MENWKTVGGWIIHGRSLRIIKGSALGVTFPEFVLDGLVEHPVCQDVVWDLETGKAVYVKNLEKISSAHLFDIANFDPEKLKEIPKNEN